MIIPEVSPNGLGLRGIARTVLRSVPRGRRDPYFDVVVREGVRKPVLFISRPDRASSRYRCLHQREQLELGGVAADVGYWGELDPLKVVDHYGCFVLYRVPWDDSLARFVETARSRGRTILADMDDLVFDADRAHLLRGLGRLADAERDAYVRSMTGFRRTLREADGVLTSTDPLLDEAAAVNPSTGVVYNAVSTEMAVLAENALGARAPAAPAKAEVTVAYLSGTPTHDRDFEEAADSVLAALGRYPHVRFLAAGFLALDARFEPFSDRVTRVEYLPWQRLPELLATVDVNLAPLERGNAFTEAKSCVKYLEAALLGTPTIASARPDFRRVVEHGSNGFLADDPREWQQALEALIESPDLRVRLGGESRRSVLEHHTTRARASDAVATFSSLAGALETPSPPLRRSHS